MTREDKAKYQRDWSRRNPDKVKANRNASYRRMHPEIKRVWTDPRRPNGASIAGSLQERNLWKRFRLTLEQYSQMVESQKNLCAICKNPERRRGKDGNLLALSVDHDHENDRVRQLLCGDCNTAIGLMKDDILRLREAILYLSRHKGA